jgi:hypothetical protein
MPYTVAYRDAGNKRHEFEAYVRLLEKRGIDWTNAIWDHIAVVLTGLSLEQLAALDGYQVYDLMAEKTVYDSRAAVAA